MNVYVIVVLLVVLIALSRLKLPFLAWIIIWPVATWLFIREGIDTWVPVSILNIYVSLAVLGVLSYLVADEERLETVKQQLTTFMVDKKYTLPLYATVVLLPLLLAGKIYADMTAPVKAPTFGRTVHPNPPGQITFKGKSINLTTGKNPYRELETKDPEAFKKHVEAGKVVYYQNCVYCHGDDMAGDGIFAHGYHPIPANFNSETTIPQLQEAYLFWRIAKGGPGLPEESGPWSSSMPAWEKFLTEEEIWDVILFLYDYTGFVPRAEEDVH